MQPHLKDLCSRPSQACASGGCQPMAGWAPSALLIGSQISRDRNPQQRFKAFHLLRRHWLSLSIVKGMFLECYSPKSRWFFIRLLPNQGVKLPMYIHSAYQVLLEVGTMFYAWFIRVWSQESNHVNKRMKQELTMGRHCAKQLGNTNTEVQPQFSMSYNPSWARFKYIKSEILISKLHKNTVIQELTARLQTAC